MSDHEDEEEEEEEEEDDIEGVKALMNRILNQMKKVLFLWYRIKIHFENLFKT